MKIKFKRSTIYRHILLIFTIHVDWTLYLKENMFMKKWKLSDYNHIKIDHNELTIKNKYDDPTSIQVSYKTYASKPFWLIYVNTKVYLMFQLQRHSTVLKNFDEKIFWSLQWRPFSQIDTGRFPKNHNSRFNSRLK